jgi:hypothetical protein
MESPDIASTRLCLGQRSRSTNSRWTFIGIFESHCCLCALSKGWMSFHECSCAPCLARILVMREFSLASRSLVTAANRERVDIILRMSLHSGDDAPGRHRGPA